MIPRSINKRNPSSIVDEWDIEIGIPKLEAEEEADSDNAHEDFSQEEYDNLRESVNHLYDNSFKINRENKIPEMSKKEEVKYIYGGIDSLHQNIDDYFFGINENGKTPRIHICAYHVNEQHKEPFLEYFLFKPSKEKGEVFKFPSFEYDSAMNVINKSMTIMQVLCLTYYKDVEYRYKGFIGNDENVYLFFDCSILHLDSYKMSRHNDLWLVTVDELINQEKVCNFSIDNTIIDFFKRHVDLLYLSDINGNVIETPTVVYFGCSRKELDFVATFGASIMNEEALMGKYYYFTDYQSAIKKCGWLNDNGGIIRCALFLGKMKVPMNRPDDNVDESLVTRDMLLKYDQNSCEFKNIQMMLRVSDRDGLWTEAYNSVYLGKFDLDDGKTFQDYPLWVVKDYNQQVVLSSHIIDKKTLDKEWTRESEYFIL